MSDLTIFNPDLANSTLRALMDLTDDLKKSADETHAFLEGRFGCWGDDETGKQFGDQYVPGYHQFWNQGKDLYDNLRDSSENLKQVKSFTEVDNRNADNLR
jgi:hypothetical protein